MLTEVSALPELPYELLHKIHANCDLYTKHTLKHLTNKAVFGCLKWTPTELADIAKLNSINLKERTFYRAILRDDLKNNHVSHLIDRDATLEDGFKLAARHRCFHALWMYVYFGDLWWIDEQRGEEVRYEAETMQTPAGLEALAKLKDIPIKDRRMYFHVSSEDLYPYGHYPGDLSRAEIGYQLRLAIHLKNTPIVWMLLAHEKWNLAMDRSHKEIVEAAHTLLSPAQIEAIAKIRKCKKFERIFFHAILNKNVYLSDDEVRDYYDDDRRPIWVHRLTGATLTYGLELAMMSGNHDAIWRLLACKKLERAQKRSEKLREVVIEAKKMLTPKQLAEITTLQKSEYPEKEFYQKTISEDPQNERKPNELLKMLAKDINVMKFGLLLAIRTGDLHTGSTILKECGQRYEAELMDVGNTACDGESSIYLQNWEIIQDMYEDDLSDVGLFSGMPYIFDNGEMHIMDMDAMDDMDDLDDLDDMDSMSMDSMDDSDLATDMDDDGF